MAEKESSVTLPPIHLGKKDTLFNMSDFDARCEAAIGRKLRRGFGVNNGQNYINSHGDKLSPAELKALGFTAAAEGSVSSFYKGKKE